MTKKKITAPSPLSAIKQKVVRYHQKMNLIAKFLKENNAPEEIQIDIEKEFMEFYIEKEALIRLNNIALLPKFEKFAVFFGLETENNSLTGCFLGIDKNKKILDAHRGRGRGIARFEPVDGENTWLPPSGGKNTKKDPRDFSLKTPLKTIKNHLKE